MVAIRLGEFGGTVPIMSRRLLPDNMSDFAANVNLESGEIRPIQLPARIHEFGNAEFHRAVRIPNVVDGGLPHWIGFQSRFARCFPSPLVNDQFKRFIWIDGNGPGKPAGLVQNSYARIEAGEPGRGLGVPPPTSAPAAVVSTEGTGAQVARAYIYTFVNDFGEEGPPSPPTEITTASDSIVQIVMETAGADPAHFGIVKYRLYRTVIGNGLTTYFRVADVDLGGGTVNGYVDNRLDVALANEGLLLESTTFRPPELMEGIIPLPGGFFAGWRGRDVFFSVPYRPWAWPAEYILSVSHDIVGCGTVGSTLVVLTESKPVLITGNTPDSMTVEKSDSIEPCVSPNATVTTPEGTYFAGRSGLLFLSAGGVTNLTRQLIGQQKWRDEYLPQNLSLVKLNDTQLMAFSSDGNGFILDLSSERAALTGLYNFVAIDSAWTDQWTGEIHLMANGTVYEWGQQLAPFSIGRWHSKEFQLAKPVNLGAFKISLDTNYPPETPSIPSVIIQPYDAVEGGPWTDRAAVYNYAQYGELQFNESLEPGTYPPGTGPGQNVGVWPYWYGVAETNVLTPINLNLPAGVAAYVGVYSRGDLIWENYVENNVPYRLPSGYKSETWQFVILTRVPVMRFEIAETGKELADV